VRQQCVPSDLVAIPPPLSSGTELFPSTVSDLDEGLAFAVRAESDLDRGRIALLPAEVPEIGKLVGWVPLGDDSPVEHCP
jgi:hypothetical protein